MNFLIKFPQWLDQNLANFLIFIIKIYQKTISPDHSKLGQTDRLSGCKFYPTCSQYATKLLKKRGFVLSIFQIIWRILRCHPWAKGGIDEPF